MVERDRKVVAWLAVLLLSSSPSASGAEEQVEQLTDSPAELVVAQGAHTVIDLGASGDLSVSQLVNSGTIFLVSSDPMVSSGALTAAYIQNNIGAVVTSVLPAGGLPGFNYLVPNFSFTLNSTGDIFNSGVISSAGNLSLSANDTITNSGIISAQSSINLSTGMGNITNLGDINARTGNLNISAFQTNNLVFNNTSGTLSALLGSITFGPGDPTKEVLNIALFGGDLYSKNLQLNAGCGIAVMDVLQASGIVGVLAKEAYMSAATATLHLGNIEISGDPTFFNTTGDVLIDSDLVFNNAPLAVVARGDIRTSAGAGKIETNGGDILLLAGIDFSSSGGPSTADPFAPVKLTLTGASGTGGSIDLVTGTAITSLDSSSATGSGGNITLVAFEGLVAGSGRIKLPTNVSLKSSGPVTSGSITLAADGSGTSIEAGNIVIDGGSGGKAIVFGANKLAMTNPATSCEGCVTVQSSKISGLDLHVHDKGSYVPIAGTLKTLDLTVYGASPGQSPGGAVGLGSVVAPGRSIRVYGQNVETGTIDVDGGQAGGSVDIYSTGGEYTINAQNAISAKGMSGGQIRLAAARINLANTSFLDVSASNGDGGLIDLRSGTYIDLPANGTIEVAGAGDAGNGGTLLLSSADGGIRSTTVFTFDASGAGTGNGGKISLYDVGQLTIGTAPSDFKLFATGGSAGSLSGNGGTIFLYSDGGNDALEFDTYDPGSAEATIDPAALQFSPLGTNGNGGQLTVDAYNGITMTSDLSVNGVGIGDGGSVIVHSEGYDMYFDRLTADAGNISGSGGTILVGTFGPLSLNPNMLSAKASAGHGGSITIRSQDTVEFGGGSIDLSGKGGSFNGGTLRLDLGKLSSPLTVNANGSGEGNGGAINISTSIPNLLSTGKLTLSATGGGPGSASGNGGSVSVDLAGNVNPGSIDVRPLGLNGDGGNISLGRINNVYGPLSVDGVGNGDGGTVVVTGAAYSVGAGITGSGIHGSISARGGALSGNAGSITLRSSSSLAITDFNQLALESAHGNGGNLTVTAQVLNVPTGVIAASGNGGDFDGGKVSINVVTYNPAGHVTIAVNGSGEGNGGTVNLQGPLGIDNIGADKINIQATGGSANSTSGNAGSVELFTGLSAINMAGLDLRPLGLSGNGGNYKFSRSGNAPAINGDIIADGVGNGNGGNVFLSLFSTAPDVIGAGSAAGVNGKVSANSNKGNGGTISIAASELTLSPGSLSATSVHGTGGAILLGAPNPITTLNLNGADLPVSSQFGNGGTISLKGSSTAIANSAGTGGKLDASGGRNGGQVTMTYTTLNLGNELSVDVTGGHASDTGSGGAVTLQTTGNLTVDMSRIQSGSKGLNGGAGELTFKSANQKLVVSGDIILNSHGTGPGGKVLLSSPSQNFAIGSPLTASGITGSISAKSDFGAPGKVTIQSRSLTVNSSVSTKSTAGAGELLFDPSSVFAPTSFVTGPGTVDSAISVAKSQDLNISLPSVPLLQIGNIAATKLTIVQDQLIIGSSSVITAGSILILGSQIQNSGILFGQSSAITFNSPNSLSLTGAGTLIGTVAFNSNQNILVDQAQLIGSYTATAPGSISVKFGAPLSTSAALASVATVTSRDSIPNVANFSIASVNISNSSSVLTTDVVRRGVALGDGVSIGRDRSFSVIVADEDCLEIADEESEVEQQDEMLFLHIGKMIVSTGKHGKTIRTPQGAVTINPGSAMSVRVSRRGTLTAQMLTGNGRYVDVKGESTTIEHGEELLSQAEGLSEGELVPVDGVTRGDFIEGGITKSQNKVVKRTISVKQLVHKDLMINGSLVRLQGVSAKTHKHYVDRMKSGLIGQDFNSDSNPIKPIAFVQKEQPGSKLKVVRDSDDLIDGQRALLAFNKPSKIKTDFGTLDFAKGSVFYADHDRKTGNLHVMNIHGEVSVLLAGNRKSVRSTIPGEEIILVNGRNLSFSDDIGRRNIHQLAEVTGVTVHSAEFSIMSLLLTNEAVRSAIASNSQLAHRVFKNCAAVMMALKRGSYSKQNSP